ncbi:helix-turn-helix domain-containing protein [Paractinoplanes maris]|uniref:helix-turn-helix domain-containing protein n=1 Tax=Paractinoplanes maris TaxID=1734446 RepID=UPI0020211428|nr:helix-turn-helix domain-containing protein [Actinoplanes maris]
MIQERYTDRHMPKLLNLNGAAEVLGVSPQYVHRLAERGQLVGAKIGASWYFRRVVVERLRDQRAGNDEGPGD